MIHFRTIANNAQLSWGLARDIAESQFDLGMESQGHMTMALAGGRKGHATHEELLDRREEAFEKLDILSQAIVCQILDSDITDATDIISSLRYASACFASVLKVVEYWDETLIETE